MRADQARVIDPQVHNLLAAGCALVLIPRGRKGPSSPGWNLRDNAVRGIENAPRFAGRNAGLLHAWSGTCAIDVDDFIAAEAWLAARGVALSALLCADNAVQVRSPRPNRAKLLYRLPDPLPSVVVSEGGLELRCASRDGLSLQDVISGAHPAGGEYRVLGDVAAMPVLPPALLELWQSLVAEPVRANGHAHAFIVTPSTVRDLQSALAMIDADDRDTWVRMAHALATLGDAGRELWDAWSRTSDKYDPVDAGRVWASLKPSSTDHKAVFAEARRRGWQNPLAARVPRALDAGSTDDASALVEDEIALRFTAASLAPGGQRWAYCAQRARWLRWDPPIWRADDTLALFDRIRAFIREHAQASVGALDGPAQVAARREAKAARTSRVVAGVERLLRADRAHAVASERLDADPMLLATPGGVVDLRTGAMRPGAPDDWLTLRTLVAPRGDCPTWLRFLDDATGGDDELVAFLQRAAGYCLTGSTDEHVLLFLWGIGANGKSTFLRALLHAMGDYGAVAPAETFLESHGDRHPTELAMLAGPRLVVAQEIDDGRQWALSRIKALTGGDPITARFMRGDFFQFQPRFKLMLAANHRPGLRNVDEAMRRRLRLVPFTVTIPPERRDPHLFDALAGEAGGILAWMVAGCLAWQREGLNAPARVMEATDDYFAGEDSFACWLSERTARGPGEVGSAELYSDYAAWSEALGERPVSHRRFSRALEDHGIRRSRERAGSRFHGIRLLAADWLATPAARAVK